MAETSEGWDGTINEAGMARILAAAADPRIDNGFTIGVVPGERRVILSPGESHYAFIRYVDTDPRMFDLPAPAAGRWHLLVQRRDWANNAVTTLVLPHTTTGTNSTLISPPTSYPDSFASNPGVVADVALYWLWVRSTDTTVITVPVSRGRAYPANYGGDSNEGSGINAIGASYRLMVLTIPTAIPAGSMMHMHAQIDLYMPNGGYAGFLRMLQLTGGTQEVGITRWHGHGRGGRWIEPTLDFTFPVFKDLAPGAQFAFESTNDPLSSGGVEVHFPRVNWFTY